MCLLNADFTSGDSKVVVVKTYTCLGIEISLSGSFKCAINRLVDKAFKAYYIQRQTFNFNNCCNLGVMQELFNVITVPILSCVAEIRNIKQFISITGHLFEKLASRICGMPSAEMGAFPFMGFFTKRIVLYWQHVLASFGKNNLVNAAIHASILMDRNDKTLYHSRVMASPSCLDMRNRIYKVLPNQMKRYSNKIRNTFSIQYLTSMKTTGKADIYHKIKKNLSIKAFGLFCRAKIINSNRMSGHCLPIEYLRRREIERDKRYCNSFN